MPRHPPHPPHAQPSPAAFQHAPAKAGLSSELTVSPALPSAPFQHTMSVRSIAPAPLRQPVPRVARPLPFFLCLVALLPTLLTGCGDNTPPGEVATMRACRICHGTDRICADIGRLDRAGWEKTVDRMIAGGASVTPEERTAVIDWLATRKPGEAPLCP